ncbi:extracellular solute-binding protein [Polyangium sp. y55x31]|uniref:extracellular solute-binding protein n=1 Tax=Polyangium sp. y55x31 TaxID=3042688 RepID=UPI0024830663|nr:extracellular solute-binding protein [Polyangium sp. y55x31]MDI1475422.1 extracellular solute-binding protein [Polyangium sp. y55x31]
MRRAARLPAALAFALVLLVACVVVLDRRARTRPASGPRTEITLLRMFGSCSDEYTGVTDLSRAVGECGVIQVLTNAFNAENDQGISVRTQTIEWSAYYDRLSAMYAAGNPPDVAVMHRSVLPDFVARDLVLPLARDLEDAGVDFGDYVDPARQAVTIRGEVYALPFDFHALLWHVNLDLMAKAGLVDARGAARLPSSPEELFAHAAQMKRRTGKHYLAIPSQTDPMPTWTLETWIWQQGGDVLSPDGRSARLSTPQAITALSLLNALYREGHADRGLDYARAEQAFLSGEAAVLINGTWVVERYDAQANSGAAALRHYGVYTVPTLFSRRAAWADSHIWVLPRHGHPDPRKHRAAVAFLRYLHDHGLNWAKTGHLPVRSSVLASEAFQALPHRADYEGTARIARALPPIQNQRAIQDVIVEEINATWHLGRTPAEGLEEAQSRVDEILKRAAR